MPDWKEEIRTRLADLKLEPARETEIVEELSQHLEDRYQESLCAGATEDEAYRATSDELKNAEILTRELRRVERTIRKEPVVLGSGGRNMIADIWQDLRYAARVMRKDPGFTFIAVFTLALGIGANTAIFSVVNAVVLRPLPYPEADRLVAIEEYRTGGNPAQVTPANFLDWREQAQSFTHIAAFHTRNANLTGEGEPERIGLANVSASFFDVLGTRPETGRLFQAPDEQAGHAPVVVISHGLWQRRFAGARDIVDKTILLDGQSYAIIGVAPSGFEFPKETDAWIPPLSLVPELYAGMNVTRVRGLGYLGAIARLKPGVTVDEAHAEMETITARLREQYPDTNSRRFDRVVSLQSHLVGTTRQALMVLLGAVGFVLLIACANVANLLLARTAARQKEMAVRAALGAWRSRVIRQMLTEGVLLACIGGACGLAIAWWGLSSLLAIAPADLPRAQEINLDGRVLLITMALSLLAGIGFGLAPAFQFARQDIYATLKEGARGTEGARRSRLRRMLVVAEVALSLVLLVGAGLLLRSFYKLQSVEPGFDAGDVLTMRVTPTGESYNNVEQVRAFYDRVIERISALPGVKSAGAVSTLPLSKGAVAGFQIEGRPQVPPSEWQGANYRVVSPDYFRALGIPILEGRGFNSSDTDQTKEVLVINQSLARRDFAGENPIGKRISFGTNSEGQPIWFEIVGIVGDIRTVDLVKEPEPDFYSLYRQASVSAMSLVIRAGVESESLVSTATAAVRDVDPNLPIADIRVMEQIVSESIAQPRFNLFLLGAFACLAMLLAAAGIYGVMSYAVTQRTQEIGIRMALGARQSDVLRMIVGQGMLLALIGIVIGAGAALALTGLMENLLYSVSATDPLTFVVIGLLLAGVALVACYIPARRAMRVDPMIALRYE